MDGALKVGPKSLRFSWVGIKWPSIRSITTTTCSWPVLVKCLATVVANHLRLVYQWLNAPQLFSPTVFKVGPLGLFYPFRYLFF